jgi:hypothetical protein
MIDLPYVCSFLYAGIMGTELEMDVELRGVFWVSSCDISQSVKRVKVTDPLFLNHCTVLLAEYKW